MATRSTASPSTGGFSAGACIASLALLLAACGGGGGGGGGGGDASDNSWLRFSPASTEVSTWSGEPKVFTITATSSRTIDGAVNVGIIDSRGVLDPTGTIISAITPLSYRVQMTTARSLAAGTYSGNLEVRLCRDNPVTCAQPIPGTPWQVPYRIVVQAANNLTPLVPLAGAGPWSTYQGNAARTGFVNAGVVPAQFNRRWVVSRVVGSMAIDGGRVFTTPPSSQSGEVVALAEDDGSDRWRWGGNMTYSGIGHGDGRIWFIFNEGSNFADTTLQGLDGATGTVTATTLLSQFNWSPRLAPVVQGSSVFIASDRANTIGRHRASDGAQEWRAIFGFAPAQRWSPAVGGGRAVMYDNRYLRIADAATGAVLGEIEGPGGSCGFDEVFGSPVLGAGSLAYVSSYYTDSCVGTTYRNGRLLAFNLDTRSLAWNVGTEVRSNPVLAGDAVYVLVTGGALQAHDAATGALRWRWDPPAYVPPPGPPPNLPAWGPDAPLLVIGRHAFVSQEQGRTFAVDLDTRQTVWEYPAAGPMAVSPNGVLFIAAPTRLHAINLR